MCVVFDFAAFFSLTKRYNLFFRRKRAEKGPPLVVEQCWPQKKARLSGSRKKRSFSSQTEPVLDAQEQTEPVLDAREQTEPVLDLAVQAEPVLDLAVVQTEPDVADVVQNEPLGRAVGRPSGFGKKRKSINKLLAVQVEKEKKPSGARGKKRQNK